MPILSEIKKKLRPSLEAKYVIYLYTLLDEVKKDNPVHGSLMFVAVASTEEETIEKGRKVEKLVREACPEKFIGVAATTTGEWDLLSTSASHRKNVDSSHKFEKDYENQENLRREMLLQLEKDAEEEPDSLAYHVNNSCAMIQSYMQMKHYEKELERVREAYSKRREVVLGSLKEHPEYAEEWRERFKDRSEKWGDLGMATVILLNEGAALNA